MRIVYILVSAMVLLSGCATNYQRQGISGGYSETKLGENIFLVSFRGNGYTSDERAADFSLLRSAELALENGFRFFAIVDSEKHSNLSAYTTPLTSQTTGSVYTSGNYAYGTATTTTYGGQTYFISKPRTTNMILCFKDKLEMTGVIFDAAFVANSIRQKYKMLN